MREKHLQNTHTTRIFYFIYFYIDILCSSHLQRLNGLIKTHERVVISFSYRNKAQSGNYQQQGG